MNINKQDGRFPFGNLDSIENAGEKFRENMKCQIVEHVCSTVQGDFSQLFHAYTLMFI